LVLVTTAILAITSAPLRDLSAWVSLVVATALPAAGLIVSSRRRAAATG
jgi:hypothetical protein